jgi:hypothetical protein
MKVIVFPAAAAGGIITALDALARAEPKRCHRVRASVRAQQPASWNGVGAVPVGFLLPYGVITEPGGARVAIIATDDFAEGKGQFSSATDALPANWST